MRGRQRCCLALCLGLAAIHTGMCTSGTSVQLRAFHTVQKRMESTLKRSQGDCPGECGSTQ